jgi:hypothetical protein
MSRFIRRLKLNITTAYPGVLGIPQLMLVQYNGDLVEYNGALVTAPNQGQQVSPNG